MAGESVKDTIASMIAGTHEDVEIEETEVEETEVDESGVDEVAEEEIAADEGDIEDTDQEEEIEEEEDTEQEIDESAEETSDTEDDAEEEDAQETDDNNVEETKEDAVEDEPAKSDEVNYKDFYEQVALAKFTANGREVEGFKDPQDLIRAQQMLHGYSDKMKVLKEYKKFLKPLEERQITADPDKFNLAMSLLDGDVEAIKKVIKDKDIDPLELDLENIQYVPKNTIQSDAQMLIEEASNQARELGVEDKFHRVLTDDFDNESLQEFVDNGAVRNDLIAHLKDGTYDIVQDEIRKMEMLDSSGELESVNSVNKYRMAINRLSAKQQQKAPIVKEEPVVDVAKLEQERVSAKKDKEAAEEFKRKAAIKEKEAAEGRKKAASVSKKRVVKSKTSQVKPESLKGDEFRDYFKNMMMN